MSTIDKKRIERVILDNLDLPGDPNETVKVVDVLKRVKMASLSLDDLFALAVAEAIEGEDGVPAQIAWLTDLRRANTVRARRGLVVSRNEILDAVIRFLETGDLPDELDPY